MPAASAGPRQQYPGASSSFPALMDPQASCSPCAPRRPISPPRPVPARPRRLQLQRSEAQPRSGRPSCLAGPVGRAGLPGRAPSPQSGGPDWASLRTARFGCASRAASQPRLAPVDRVGPRPACASTGQALQPYHPGGPACLCLGEAEAFGGPCGQWRPRKAEPCQARAASSPRGKAAKLPASPRSLCARSTGRTPWLAASGGHRTHLTELASSVLL